MRQARSSLQKTIEIGHIFKLGLRYSEPMRARVLDAEGKERPLVMGSYGIGLDRIMAAAIEAHHDADGIIWPLSIAPFDVVVVSPVKVKDSTAQMQVAEELCTHSSFAKPASKSCSTTATSVRASSSRTPT